MLISASIVGIAVAGATFYLWRLSQGPEVTWNRKGDWRPWDKVKYDQNVRFSPLPHHFYPLFHSIPSLPWRMKHPP